MKTMMMKCISIRVLMLIGVVGGEDYLPFRKTTTFSKGMDVNITIRGEETLGLPGRGRDGDGGRGYDGGREGSGGSPLASNINTNTNTNTIKASNNNNNDNNNSTTAGNRNKKAMAGTLKDEKMSKEDDTGKGNGSKTGPPTVSLRYFQTVYCLDLTCSLVCFVAQIVMLIFITVLSLSVCLSLCLCLSIESFNTSTNYTTHSSTNSSPHSSTDSPANKFVYSFAD